MKEDQNKPLYAIGASVVMHRADELGPVARELWSYRKLLDILEQLLGPEIVGHPVWNVRIKLPDHESEVVPWHQVQLTNNYHSSCTQRKLSPFAQQDNGYFSDDACGTMIATAWIPMLDTNLLNGGMQVVRNSHRRGLLGEGCQHKRFLSVLRTFLHNFCF